MVTAEQPLVGTYVRPWLYPKQRDAIFCPERYGVIEASTKSGKTVGCIVWLFEQALLTGKPGRNYWWIAPVYSQAQIAYRRMLQSLPRGMFHANETDLTLTIVANGAVIWFKTGDNPDRLYGEDVYVAVIDEATRCKLQSWYAIRSTLTATRGPIRIIGNVKGTQNWAYEMARRAEHGAPDMHYARITAYDAVEAGVLRAEEIEDAKAHYSERMFRELYLAEPADTMGLIYAPFSAANITAEAVYVPDGGPIVLGYDWGFTDPTAIGMYQIRDARLYQFAELYGSGMPERTWVRAAVRYIVALPGYDGPTYEQWEAIWDRNAPWPAPWPNVWPELACGDPSAVQLRAEFKQHGIGAASPKRVSHNVESGQDVLRALVLSANGERRLLVHPDCKQTIECFENYRAKELADGSYDARPDPSPENHRYSHGTDQGRYLAWAYRRRFGIRMSAAEEPEEEERDAARPA